MAFKEISSAARPEGLKKKFSKGKMVVEEDGTRSKANVQIRFPESYVLPEVCYTIELKTSRRMCEGG